MDIQQDAAHNVPDVILHNGLQDGARQHFDGRKLILTPKKPSTIWRREARPLGLSENNAITEIVTDIITEIVMVTEVVTVTIVDFVIVTETVTVILP